MRPATVSKWLRTGVLGVALALPLPAGPLPGALTAGPLAAVTVGAAVALAPVPAEAQRSSRSSGGYTRPGGGYTSRTPSFGAPGGSFGRSPSTSGGYRQPAPGGSGLDGAPLGTPSPGDRSFSRRSSREALDRYRAQQDQQQLGRPPATVPGPAPAEPFGANRRRGAADGWYPDRPGWAARRGWSVPSYAYRSPPSFGIWNALFLWFLLDTLSQPGHAGFFHNHQNDPGYQQWRAEADQKAAQDPELRAKLDELDAKLAQERNQPRDPNYLPPDTTRDMALAEHRDVAPGGVGAVLVPLLLGGGIVFLIWRWRRQAAGPSGRSAGPGGGQGGPGPMGPMKSGPLKTAAEMVRRKLSGERYTPSLFRVGMTLTLDPTPFILAAGTTKVTLPAVAGGNQLVSVAAVGTVEDGTTTLYRLYLPEDQGFFQLHLDAAGQPDECRFFAPLDEVNPASEAEWGFWLDPQEGMIGWPEFQTKDSKVYPRIWAPGPTRIPPRLLSETISDVRAMTVRRSQAMLYGAPTGAAPPAPQTEYILVAAVEEGGQAWVAIHAGIDINPAALSLA